MAPSPAACPGPSYSQALALAPASDRAQRRALLSNRSRAHLAAGRARDALADAHAAAKAAPGWAKAHWRAGRALGALDRWVGAGARLLALSTRVPVTQWRDVCVELDACTHVYTHKIQSDARRWPEALDAYARAHELSGGDAECAGALRSASARLTLQQAADCLLELLLSAGGSPGGSSGSPRTQSSPDGTGRSPDALWGDDPFGGGWWDRERDAAAAPAVLIAAAARSFSNNGRAITNGGRDATPPAAAASEAGSHGVLAVVAAAADAGAPCQSGGAVAREGAGALCRAGAVVSTGGAGGGGELCAVDAEGRLVRGGAARLRREALREAMFLEVKASDPGGCSSHLLAPWPRVAGPRAPRPLAKFRAALGRRRRAKRRAQRGAALRHAPPLPTRVDGPHSQPLPHARASRQQSGGTRSAGGSRSPRDARRPTRPRSRARRSPPASASGAPRAARRARRRCCWPAGSKPTKCC